MASSMLEEEREKGSSGLGNHIGLAKNGFSGLNELFQKPHEAQKDCFEQLWCDARALEAELEVLRWMARRKEMEWDCTRLMILKKKSSIKSVKKTINMIRTVHDLGPQLNVDSDDEDTPYEDDDSSDEGSQASSVSSRRRRPQIISKPTAVSQKDRSAKFVKAGQAQQKPSYSKGHLCLQCKVKEPLFVCSECHDHWYCSNACHENHWPSHEPACVKFSSKAKASSTKRKTPLLSHPTTASDCSEVQVPKRPRDMHTDKCLMCRSEQPKFLCGGCKNRWYCSFACHQLDWPDHQLNCERL